jgi:hypothetical protein
LTMGLARYVDLAKVVIDKSDVGLGVGTWPRSTAAVYRYCRATTTGEALINAAGLLPKTVKRQKPCFLVKHFPEPNRSLGIPVSKDLAAISLF